MIDIRRTDSIDPFFQKLVHLLDAELAIRDGSEHDFYHQFNGIDSIKYVVVGFLSGKAVACGAIKELDEQTMEVKRMYVTENERGKGYASSILNELEIWALELGFAKCRLETGIRQPEAIALYKKNGYQQIPNYGQYQNVENSVCFEKRINI